MKKNNNYWDYVDVELDTMEAYLRYPGGIELLEIEFWFRYIIKRQIGILN